MAVIRISVTITPITIAANVAFQMMLFSCSGGIFSVIWN